MQDPEVQPERSLDRKDYPAHGTSSVLASIVSDALKPVTAALHSRSTAEGVLHCLLQQFFSHAQQVSVDVLCQTIDALLPSGCGSQSKG